jgi:hypothetical protein
VSFEIVARISDLVGAPPFFAIAESPRVWQSVLKIDHAIRESVRNISQAAHDANAFYSRVWRTRCGFAGLAALASARRALQMRG